MNKDMTLEKKHYVKPDVMEVVYEMDSNIAAGCNVITNNPTDYNDCSYEENDYSVFLDHCDDNADDYGFCYHVPTPSSSVFTS
jgi:hypothetical protein